MKRILVFVLCAFILASCGSPDENDTDWCYTFYFPNSTNNFNITAGVWSEGQGLKTDDSGLLMFSYGYDRFVEPKYILVTVARPIGIVGDIPANVQGSIFGIGGSFSASLPSDQNSAMITLQSDTIGLAGKDVNVSVDSSSQLVIREIEVRGDGSNPFPSNECDKSPFQPTQPPDATLTVVTPTPIPTLSATSTTLPTATSTPTTTLTPSITPTPSNTPTGTWTCAFDFSASQGGWQTISTAVPAGSYSSGNGWVTGFNAAANINQVAVERLFTATLITNVSFVYDASAGSVASDSTRPRSIQLQNGASVVNETSTITYGTNQSYAWSGSVTAERIAIALVPANRVGTSPAVNGSATIKSASVSGVGTVPFTPGTGVICDSATPTPTYTPSITSTPNDATNTAAAETSTAAASITPFYSVTPSESYICTYSFALNGNGGFVTLADGFYSPGAGWLGVSSFGNNILQIQRTITATQINFMKLTWLVEIPAAALTVDSPYGAGSTINVTTGTRVQTFNSIQTNVTSLIFSGTGSSVNGKRLVLVGVEIQGKGARPAGAVCGNPTATPDVSRTPIASVTPPPSSRTPIPPPPQLVTPTYVTVTPGGPTPDIDGSATAWIGTATIIAGTPGGDQGAGETGTGLGTGVGVGGGFGNIFIDWLGQVGVSISTLTDSFINAAPQPIPGLPLCMSNPLDHDICAIYYILDWTLLAPGTPGEHIVPILQIIMNVYIVIYFVKRVLAIVRRGESVTNVG